MASGDETAPAREYRAEIAGTGLFSTLPLARTGLKRNLDRAAPASTQSPCVRNCCLDENDVCLGCGRLLDEILRWRSMTDEEREQIQVLARNRRMQRMRGFFDKG